MQIGRHRVSLHNHGFFRLDGGAMFGSVPKTMWERLAPPDELNRILMATRSLVIEDGGRRILVDLGCGDKYTEKTRAIYEIPEGPYQPVEGVTDVLVTHLHFDHVGGVSKFIGSDGEVAPNYPKAKHWVSRANLENALAPNVREKASYLKENTSALDMVELILTEDGQEIFPGITVHQAHGHTRGLQWIKLTDGGQTVAYPTDMFPTSKHLPVPYVMGYDICAEESMNERAVFLEQAIAESWIVVFEHDPEVGAARLAWDERGRPVVAENVDCGLGIVD